VVALGLANRLVGVTRYDDAREVAALPRVGGFVDPNPEAILAAKPDLVLWQTDGGAAPVVRRLAALGIPVLAIPIVNLQDVLAAIRLVGAALGKAPAGEALAGSLAAEIEAVRSWAAGLEPARAFLLVGRQPLVVAGPGSFPDELLRLAGATNLAGGRQPWPVYPLEKVVAARPEVVLDAATNEPRDAAGGLASLVAKRGGRYHCLANDWVLRPGPKVALALRQIFSLLHPGSQLNTGPGTALDTRPGTALDTRPGTAPGAPKVSGGQPAEPAR
jgi:iron complex transport system substrate-binding protein